MGVFLDSGFFLGLLHPTDPHHDYCKDSLKKISTGQFGLIFTSVFVIAETATLILFRTKNNPRVLKLFRNIIQGEQKFVRILQSTPQITKQAWDIFFAHNQGFAYKRQYLSYVDATNIAFCREKEISHIVAVDGDFENYLIKL
ncbi:MAG: type II toxin-antitoxin system VapC family toxin [Promethearchaeota archaeon]